MNRFPWCRAWFTVVSSLSLLSAAPQAPKLFIDSGNDELTRAVPDLSGLHFDSNQAPLDSILAETGKNLAAMFAKLGDLGANEQIHEIRFEQGMDESNRLETYRYLIKPAALDAVESFDEERVIPATGAPAPPPSPDFLVISHFEKLLGYLLPQYRDESHFRYLGRMEINGHDTLVLAFAQRPDSKNLRSHIGLGGGRTALLQGLAWIDAATHRIVRLRVDLPAPVEGFPLETLTTDIAVVPVQFPSGGDTPWLPARVTVHARYAGGEFHTVHRYSDYKLKEGDAGVSAAPVNTADDPWEMLQHASALAAENKPADAIALFREALRLNPNMAVGLYHLAATLRAGGDFAGAETELKEVVRESPDFGPAHNFLGILLFRRGDAAGAAAELRASVQLQPKDPTVHMNLAKVLEKADPPAAVEEYRVASTLAPDDAAIKARYEQFAASAKNAPALESTGPTIKVDVRQVLVPVVVTDKQGHHVTGLKQSDFHVFEDGVEQKITAFSVENAGVTAAVAAPPAVEPGTLPPTAAPPVTPVKPVVRRTYLICIDTLHTEFADLVHARTALEKLFSSEQAGDAQYVVLAVGAGVEVMQAPTTDPVVVLKAIESKDFEKLFAGHQGTSMLAELKAFRQALDNARRACDTGSPLCVPLKIALPPQAEQIASQARLYDVSFLQNLRRVIEELAKGGGRRTIVLVSGGFQLVPGKEAFDLLEGYFGSRGPAEVDRLTQLDAVLHLAANHNIPIYTIDARGLYTQSFYDASDSGPTRSMGPTVLAVTNRSAAEAGETLREIAAATGGTAFQNSNDIFAGLARAFSDGRQYYVLAYVSTNANQDGKFRAISVHLRDQKLAVSAKRGYWASAE